MNDTYWVRHQGRSLGPYAIDKIRQMVRKGQVGRVQEVSTDGASWAPATSFPEIFERPSHEPVAAHQSAEGRASSASATPISAPAPPAEQQWYCAANGVQQGPIPRSQLLSLIRAGRLTEADLVFRDGMADWVAAGEAAEIASAFGSVGGGQRSLGMDAFCRECGSAVSKKAKLCPKCGAPTTIDDFPPPDAMGPGPGIEIRLGGPGGGRSTNRGGDPKSKVVAGILALMLGGLGVHHFYLGNATLGVVYLLFCWTLIPALVSFIEAIVFLTMSDESFDRKYN